MELHYIWIENFYNIKKKEINFSSKYIIRLLPGKNNGEKLRIEFNNDYIPGFFGKDNIQNVTAVIGENGTGKSSILEYIKARLPQGVSNKIDGDILVYTIENGKRGIVEYPYGLNLELDDHTGLFTLDKYDQTGFMEDPINIKNSFRNAQYIYYSFFLDYRTEATGYTGITNISTTALLTEHRLPSDDELQKKEIIKDNSSSDIDIMIANETAKAIQLLNSEYKNFLPFETPDELQILVNNHEKNNFTIPNGFQPRLNVPASYLETVKSLEKINSVKGKGVEDRAIGNLIIALFVNFLYGQFVYNKNGHYLNEFEEVVRELDDLEKFIIRFMRNYIAYINSNSRDQDTYLLKKCQAVVDFVFYVEDLISDGHLDVKVNKENSEIATIILPMTAKSTNLFKDFMNHYLEAKGFSAFLDFRWRSLSTGEQSFLSFFARIHHIRFHETGGITNKNLVFLIDEGDAGYHPNWQRTFFKNTIDFVSAVFEGHSLQFIFTSNTPFLTSDLTNCHIIFIEKDKEKNTSIIHNKDYQKNSTFGANIHSLFSDTFYMKGVLIGDFAKKKIQEVIDFLNNDQINKPDEQIRKLIGQLGEPILKRKLEEMWIKKFGDGEEIALLQLRIEQIRQNQKNN